MAYSVRYLTVFLLVCVSIVPIMIFGLITIYADEQILRERQLAFLEETVTQQVRTTDLFFTERFFDISVLSQIPAKEIISFTSDETIHDVFNKMLKNNVRRLRFEDTPRLISDRTLLNDICIQMNYLKFTENLLETKANTLTTEKPDEITDDLTISQMAKKLATMIHPFVLYKEQIITPWDLLMMFYNGEKQ